MAIDVLINTSRPYGISDPGNAFDFRPGVIPSDWFFNQTYAWPVPSGPSPITLKPTPLDPSWETTVYDGTQNSEQYRRYTKDQFTMITGSNFTQYAGTNATDWTLLTREAVTSFTSNEPLDFGEGLYLEFCCSGRHGTNKKLMEVQFGNPSPSKAFWLTIYENGLGYLSTGPIDLSDPTNQLANGFIVPNNVGSIINRWIKLFIFGHGRNKLSVISSTGNGFLYENRLVSKSNPKSSQSTGFTPLSALPIGNDESLLTSPHLLKGSFFRIGTYSKTAIKPRPIPYSLMGTIKLKRPTLAVVQTRVSLTSSDIHHVTTGDIFGFPAGSNGPSMFYTPASVNAQQQTLNPTVLMLRPNTHHKDVNKTPQFYRDEATIPQTSNSQPNNGVSFLSDMIELKHNQSETATTGSIKIRYAENHSAYYSGFGLPLEYSEGGNIWLKTLLIKPTWEEKGLPTYTGVGFINRQQYLSWDMIGLEKDLEEAFVQCVTRFDGIPIDVAIKLLLTSIGFPADGSQWDIDSLPLDANGNSSNTTSKGETDNEPTNLSEVAKSVIEWIRYFIDTYTSCAEYPFHWVAGFRPFYNVSTGLYEWRFFFKNPDLFDKGPGKSVFTFYPSEDIAMYYDNTVPYNTAYKYKHMDMYKPESLEPECNHLFVYGEEQTVKQNTEEQNNTIANNNSDSILSTEIMDRASQNPNTSLGSRPSNWLGKDKRIVFIDGALNTQALVTAAAAKMFPRLALARQTTSLQAEWNPIIRIWDQVTTYSWKHVIPNPNVTYTTMRNNVNNFDITQWRVVGIDVQHIQDVDTNPGLLKHRKATYHLERFIP